MLQSRPHHRQAARVIIGLTPQPVNTGPEVVLCYCPITTLPNDGPASSEINRIVSDLVGENEPGAPDPFRLASPLRRITAEELSFLFLHGEANGAVGPSQSVDTCSKPRAAGSNAYSLANFPISVDFPPQ